MGRSNEALDSQASNRAELAFVRKGAAAMPSKARATKVRPGELPVDYDALDLRRRTPTSPAFRRAPEQRQATLAELSDRVLEMSGFAMTAIVCSCVAVYLLVVVFLG